VWLGPNIESYPAQHVYLAEYSANRVVSDASPCVNDDLIESSHPSDRCEHPPNRFGGHDDD
jgi:hypothetical protein